MLLFTNPLRNLPTETVSLLAVLIIALCALFVLSMWVFYSAAIAQLATATGHSHAFLGFIPIVQLIYFARLADDSARTHKADRKPIWTILSGLSIGLVLFGLILFFINDAVPFIPSGSTVICGGIAGVGVLLGVVLQYIMADLYTRTVDTENRTLLLVFSIVAFPVAPVFLWMVSRSAMTDLLLAWQRTAGQTDQKAADKQPVQEQAVPDKKPAKHLRNGDGLDSDDQLYS